ncbi:MAG TPA: flagellar hook-basal body protein [Clostridiales bacterium UBA8153]|nr:flagellar hook-basal body protein [Clostridiales bacterium UBA8153]
MMRSMFSAIGGMKNHQIRMDVIAHNIANVNTVGFKAGRATFQEVLSQTLRGASAPQDQRGGTNAMQVGLGMKLMGIDTMFQQGSSQATGRGTDLAIQGDGFFVVRDGDRQVFTRTGVFDLDGDGYLVEPGGRRVQGWTAGPAGLNTEDASAIGDIRISLGQATSAQATTAVGLAGNLDSTTAVGYQRTTTVAAFDSLGQPVPLLLTFTKSAVNQWNWQVSGPAAMTPTGGTGTLTFGTDGRLSGSTGTPITLAPPGAAALVVTMGFGELTQAAGPSSVEVATRDGFTRGEIETFAIDNTGTITAFFSNGINRQLARLALANFANQGGLLRDGDSLFSASNNSGLARIGEAGTGGRGYINAGYLEQSNVDLAVEFSDMMVIQRGFQANSRVITTTDEFLNELVNLKR